VEALKKERETLLTRITDFLTPRINGEEGCSEQERIEFETERVSSSERIEEIDAELANMEPQTLPEAVIVEPTLAMVEGMPLESLTRNESAAILIRHTVDSMLKRLAETHNEIVSKLENDLRISLENAEELKIDRNKFQTLSEELEVKNGELMASHHHANIERIEAFKIKDNALSRFNELELEHEQVKSELKKLQVVRSYTEAEQTEQAERAMQAFLDSRIKVYNVRWEDEIRCTHYLAERAEDGESIRYSRLEAGGHVEVTEAEALAIQALNKPIEMPEVESQEEFQSEDTSEVETEQGDQQEDSRSDESTLGQTEPQPTEFVTRAEFNELKHAVDVLYTRQNAIEQELVA
jgi:hypothetical protein